MMSWCSCAASAPVPIAMGSTADVFACRFDIMGGVGIRVEVLAS